MCISEATVRLLADGRTATGRFLGERFCLQRRRRTQGPFAPRGRTGEQENRRAAALGRAANIPTTLGFPKSAIGNRARSGVSGQQWDLLRPPLRRATKPSQGEGPCEGLAVPRKGWMPGVRAQASGRRTQKACPPCVWLARPTAADALRDFKRGPDDATSAPGRGSVQSVRGVRLLR